MIFKKRFKDKRVFERIPARLSLRLRDTATNRWSLVQAEDLSARGIGLVTEKEFPAKTPLEIWLPILNKGEKFYTRGNVAWSRFLETSNQYRVGVELAQPEFMGISEVLRGIPQ
jgi:hypothetical protein